MDNQSDVKSALNTQGPVLFDFHAEWCISCEVLQPMLSKLANEFKDRLTVCRVNIEDHPEVAENFDVKSVPALVFVSKGEKQEMIVGYAYEHTLRNKMEALCA